MRGQYFEYLDQWERSTLTSARPLLVSDGSLRVKETSSPVPSVPASLCCWRNPSGSTLKAFSWLDWNKNFSSLFCRLRFQYFYLLSGIIFMETNKIETRRNVVGFIEKVANIENRDILKKSYFFTFKVSSIFVITLWSLMRTYLISWPLAAETSFKWSSLLTQRRKLS